VLPQTVFGAAAHCLRALHCAHHTLQCSKHAAEGAHCSKHAAACTQLALQCGPNWPPVSRSHRWRALSLSLSLNLSLSLSLKLILSLEPDAHFRPSLAHFSTGQTSHRRAPPLAAGEPVGGRPKVLRSRSPKGRLLSARLPIVRQLCWVHWQMDAFGPFANCSTRRQVEASGYQLMPLEHVCLKEARVQTNHLSSAQMAAKCVNQTGEETEQKSAEETEHKFAPVSSSSFSRQSGSPFSSPFHFSNVKSVSQQMVLISSTA